MERLLGTNRQGKFPALAATIISYARSTAHETVAVRNVSAMWDNNLKGIYATIQEMHAIRIYVLILTLSHLQYCLTLLPGYDAVLALRYLTAMLGNKRAKNDPDDLIREVPVSELRQH